VPAAVLERGDARPFAEREREVRVIGIAQIEGDADDLGIGPREQVGGNVVAHVLHEVLEAEPVVAEAALQRAHAHAERSGRMVDPRVPVARRHRGDDAAHAAREVARRRRVEPSFDVERGCA